MGGGVRTEGVVPGRATAGSGEFGREAAFELLSNGRRRMIVRDLLAHDGVATLRELSRRIAARENDKDVERITAEERRRVYNALQQVHLPKMDDWGVVAYDDARGTVEPTDRLEDLRAYLDATPRDTVPWGRYYALLGAVCVALTATAWAGVPPLDRLSGFAVALFVSLSLVVSGVAHHQREMRFEDRDGDGDGSSGRR